MLRKTVLAAMLAASVVLPAPAATAGPYEECMLYAGCFWVSGHPENPGYWVCPNPQLAQDCVEP